ncbi:MAG: hypothetical protein ACM3MK_00275 [Chitinophagales bacterium]
MSYSRQQHLTSNYVPLQNYSPSYVLSKCNTLVYFVWGERLTSDIRRAIVTPGTVEANFQWRVRATGVVLPATTIADVVLAGCPTPVKQAVGVAGEETRSE